MFKVNNKDTRTTSLTNFLKKKNYAPKMEKMG